VSSVAEKKPKRKAHNSDCRGFVVVIEGFAWMWRPGCGISALFETDVLPEASKARMRPHSEQVRGL
jgi:hypothetical protein